MTSIKFKVMGLSGPGFEIGNSGIESAIFGIPDLPEREADALLIWPPQLVGRVSVCTHADIYNLRNQPAGTMITLS